MDIGAVLESPLEAIAAEALDCLVIGSGTAGVTSAIELAESGLKVAIVEAGPFLLTSHVGSSPFAHRDDIVPKIHNLVRYRTLYVSSTQEAAAREGTVAGNNNAWSVVGGRTLFWGGFTPRFLDSDFQSWPYDADTLRPWYERAEKLIGCSGGGTDNAPFIAHEAQDGLIEKLRRDGIAASHAPLGIDTAHVRNGHVSAGFDSSVARLLRCHHFGRTEDRARLSLSAQAVACKLHYSNGRVSGAAVLDRRTGRVFDVAARHVVLAAGCLQSVRLALASGLADLDPLIGHYVGDHLFRQAVLRLPAPLGEKSLYVFMPASADRPYHVQLQGMFPETWYSPLHATVWLDGSKTGQYMLFYCFGTSAAAADARVVLNGAAGGREHQLENYYVVNDRTPEDLDVLRSMSDFLAKSAEALGADVVRTEENIAGSALHEYGGLRMGNDRQSSVTDPTGKFWRLKGLSCADSAVWPSQGSANSYLTITAVALRHASLLAEELGARGRTRD